MSYTNNTAQRLKSTISEWDKDIASTGSVVAHEIGHVIGMHHDFGDGHSARLDSSGSNCKSGKGVMGYGLSNGNRSEIDRFSTCSKEDFLEWYNDEEGGSSCLAGSKLLLYFLIYMAVFLRNIIILTKLFLQKFMKT